MASLPIRLRRIDVYKRQAQKRYASHGITLIQEGLVVDEMLPLYQKIVESGILKLDVVGYLDMKGAGKFLEAMGKHRCV